MLRLIVLLIAGIVFIGAGCISFRANSIPERVRGLEWVCIGILLLVLGLQL